MSIVTNTWSAIGYVPAGFDEPELRGWLERLRAGLGQPSVTLGLVFLSPSLMPQAASVLELVQVHAKVSLLAGCSGGGLIAGAEEYEGAEGMVVGLYHLPGAELHGLHVDAALLEGISGGGEPGRGEANGWLIFADPFSLDGDGWLRQWSAAHPGVPTYGGLASARLEGQRTQLYLNGKVYEEGAVAVAFGGAVRLRGAVSQGCTPIGEPWTLTRVEGNLIHQIGNRPAYEVLIETVSALETEVQERARGNLFLGLVTNEYKDAFERGDFLIRNLLGGDPSSGILAVGARPRAGQSVQFQCRDAAAATEDLRATLARAVREVGVWSVYGGCLCTCAGRGQRLFGQPNHDAAAVQQQFGPLGLTGFFGNGEIGPVNGQNHLHGYTASLALFTRA